MDKYSLIVVMASVISNIYIIIYYQKFIANLKKNHNHIVSDQMRLKDSLLKMKNDEIEALKKQPVPTLELKQFLQDMMVNSSGLIEIKRLDPNNLFYHNIRG